MPHSPACPRLSQRERAVLLVLIESAGRVVPRAELARRAGLDDLSERRTDTLLVSVRRALPDGSIRTVRKRGWVLRPEALEDARRCLIEAR